MACATMWPASSTRRRCCARHSVSANSARRACGPCAVSGLPWTPARGSIEPAPGPIAAVSTDRARRPSPSAPCSGLVGEHLVDRRPAGLKALPGGAQIQPPDACALGSGERDRLVVAGLVALDPVAEGPRVVLGQPFDVTGDQAGPLERLLDP